ncbi:MAG: tetratricopeptide repeat protein, partial [Pedobacter sp.]
MKLFLLFGLFFFYKKSLSQPPDTFLIKRLVNHAIVLYPDKADSILYYAYYIRQESLKLNYPYGETYSYRLMGSYHRFNDNFDSARVYFQQFLDKAKFHKLAFAEWLAIIDIADVNMNVGEYEHALTLYLKAVSITPQLDGNFKNYSHVYNGLADAYQYLKKYDSAVRYFKEAIRYDILAGDSVRLAERKSNVSEVLMLKGELNEAEQYLNESLAYNSRNNIIDALWYNYCNLGKLHLLKNNLSLSEKYFRLAYKQSEKTTSPFKVSDALDGLSEVYRIQGNFKKAMEYKLLADSADWIADKEKIAKDFSRLQERHKTSKKEQENYRLLYFLEKEVQKKRNLTTAIIVLNILL